MEMFAVFSKRFLILSNFSRKFGKYLENFSNMHLDGSGGEALPQKRANLLT